VRQFSRVLVTTDGRVRNRPLRDYEAWLEFFTPLCERGVRL
jgi:hypothetical protein